MLRAPIFTLGAALLMPGAAQAAESGFFGGLDVMGGIAGGASDTRDGGAPFAGGGIVENLEFGETIGLGGHFGYRFESSFSTFLSYQHARGSIGWDAVFPLISAASSYQGDALSNTVMVNVGYDWALTEATFIGASAGVGLSVNTLSGVVETDRPSGLFLSDVKDHSRVSPAAQVALSVQHTFASGLELGLNAAVSYTGGFDTGDTRVGNLGITAINPYRIDDVWRAGLGASLRYRF